MQLSVGERHNARTAAKYRVNLMVGEKLWLKVSVKFQRVVGFNTSVLLSHKSISSSIGSPCTKLVQMGDFNHSI